MCKFKQYMLLWLYIVRMVSLVTKYHIAYLLYNIIVYVHLTVH